MAGGEVYQFDEFTFEPDEQRLSRSGQPISLAPKAHQILATLLGRAGRLVTKREILDSVWPESFVEEGIIAVHIAAIRRALGESLIETVPRAGYRFVAAVKKQTEERRFSVAVLPARPLTSEVLSERDRAAGLELADAFIDRLGQLEQVLVRPTRAVLPYVNTAGDPAAIGRSLRVEAVVDTCFLSTADHVRFSVRLIRSEDGALLWSGTFDDIGGGIAAMIDGVAGVLFPRLDTSPRPHQVGGDTFRRASHNGVYELVGRGRFHLLSYSMFTVPEAVKAFRTAIDIDPTYAPAHAGLASAFCAQASLRVVPPSDAYAEARSAALRAIALDDACADAQAALGAVMFFSEWNWTAAERSLKRALQINPNHSEAYLTYGQLLEALGSLDQALATKMRALERDPFSPLIHLQISLTFWNQRRYDDAIEWAAKALEIDPRHPHAREHLAGAYLKKGDFDRFVEENLTHAQIHGTPPETIDELRNTLKGGRAAMVAFVLERAARQPLAFPAMQLALFHGESGDLDAAFLHLDRAIEARDPSLVFLAVAPQWDPLRTDPRFDDRLSRIGLPSARNAR